MPDHVHFFISPLEREANLSKYIQAFRSLVTRQLRPLGYPYPLWQREFFDHLLRSDESYEQKWHYVLNNPFGAGLVRRWGRLALRWRTSSPAIVAAKLFCGQMRRDCTQRRE